ncbi:MAG: uncharacterized protein KVP18_004730 [Porospora cf. gigantea A]|uniref:uncharacterized protein n=1 Tax=Porospora cf. gigantea A TaxID=2853593 RepID=UPI00355ACAB1|nr:MAG: hypothetical protein KVP18_004730 [Porospora cf. gigantea A]
MNQEAVSATVLDVCSSQQLAVVKDLRVVLKDLYAEVLSQISETTHRRQNIDPRSEPRTVQNVESLRCKPHPQNDPHNLRLFWDLLHIRNRLSSKADQLEILEGELIEVYHVEEEESRVARAKALQDIRLSNHFDPLGSAVRGVNLIKGGDDAALQFLPQLSRLQSHLATKQLQVTETAKLLKVLAGINRCLHNESAAAKSRARREENMLRFDEWLLESNTARNEAELEAARQAYERDFEVYETTSKKVKTELRTLEGKVDIFYSKLMEAFNDVAVRKAKQAVAAQEALAPKKSKVKGEGAKKKKKKVKEGVRE